MTGLTRQKAAEAVASLFGTMARQTHESRTYDPWEVIDNEGKKWRFVYDSSIHASHRIGRQQLPISDGTYKVEMNSPKLEYRQNDINPFICPSLRLQGWADERIDIVLPLQSDAQLYKQAGNGVTVTVVEAIGKRLAAAHREVTAID